MTPDPAPVKNSPNYIDGLVSDLMLTVPPEKPSNVLNDAAWVRQAFVISTDTKTKIPSIDPEDLINGKFSSASIKYTDSSLGGNICINPPPAFTRYADVPDKGIRRGAIDTGVGYHAGDIGMGRYYSEAIDDNSQIIHMRFGVAQYNSLFQFFTGFYSSSAGQAARAGRFDDGFVNKFLRFGAGVIALAIAPLAIVPVAILMFGSAVRYFMKWPTSKFYTMKPSMEMYWNAVTSLVNQIGVNQGLINYMEPHQKEKILGQEASFSTPELSVFSQIMPEFSKNGTIDVYAIANRAARLQASHEQLKLEAFKKAGTKDFFGVIKEVMGTSLNPTTLDTGGGHTSLEQYLERFIKFEFFSKANSTDGSIEKDVKYPKDGGSKTADTEAAKASVYTNDVPVDGFLSHFEANMHDGSDWASFRVDYTGPVNESFSNSASPSSLAQKINSASSSAREMRMNVSGGVVGDVVDAVGGALATIGSTLHLEGLAAFAGSCFVDIPQHWESSSASLPTASYSMTLISPYGNPVSKMFNIYVPLAMLLAGALPLATGKQSYTSPFLCELHDRGRVITRLGLIKDMSITRGSSNLGFNNEGQAMAVDVTFSVMDLSSIVAMPIQPGFSFMPFEGLFDAENAFTDYLMALSGMKLRDTVDRFPMLKYQVNNKLADIDTFFSSSHWAQFTSNMPGVSSLKGFMIGQTNRK
jgi:hypothetical protein